MFFKQNPKAGAGKRAREQALEQIQTNLNWISKHEKTILNWLEENYNKNV